MPFKKHNPNIRAPLKVKGKPSSKMIKKPTATKSSGFEKHGGDVGKENRIGLPIVRSTSPVPALSARGKYEGPPDWLGISSSEQAMQDGYVYKLTDLHDSSPKQDELITGKPLSLASFSLLSIKSKLFGSPLRSRPEAWPKMLATEPTTSFLSPVDPPCTVRTSSGSSFFDLNGVEEHPPIINTNEKSFEVYADSNMEPDPLLDAVLYRTEVGVQGLSTRKQCVHMIRSLCNKSTRKAADEATSVLYEMIRKFHQGSRDFAPDGACFNWCINAYAQLGLPGESTHILHLMFYSFKRGNEQAEPNTRCFTGLLHAWRKSKLAEAPQRCTHLLRVMQSLSERRDFGLKYIKPDAFSLSVVMQCWLEAGRDDATEHVKNAFDYMYDQFRRGDISMCPDRVSYTLLLSSYAKDENVVAAEEHLSEFIQSYQQDNSRAQPTTRNFNTVLAMYARSETSDAPHMAENLLSRFRDLATRGLLIDKPDAWTIKSGRKDGIEQAVTCFHWMRGLGDNGDAAAAPDNVKYNTIITAYVHQDKVYQAVDMFKLQLSDCNAGKHCKPDQYFCEFVINACAIHPDGRKIRLGELLLDTLWSLHDSGVLGFKPRFLTYKNLIRARITLKDPLRALKLLTDLQEKNPPYASQSLIGMYRGVLFACKDLEDPQRGATVAKIRWMMKTLF